MKASYVCKSGETVAFDNGDKLVIKDLQYQAFVVEDGKFATGWYSVVWYAINKYLLNY